MTPRFAADYRTLVWTCLFAPAVVAIQFAKPELVPYLWWVSCYLAIACGVIAHNHNHSPTMKSKRANTWFGNWISIFYGYPTFAWIPTHNLNHHKFVNKPGDATITWRYTNRHNALMAATYFFMSAYFQAEPIKVFIKKAKEKNRSLYRRVIAQYFIVYGTHAALLTLAIVLHGWKIGALVWLFACGIPGFAALWTIMLFNYEQHVHTDPWSRHNHSRNFVSPVLNFLLFNNGYHTAHHESAGAHWTTLKEIHDRLAPNIDDRLIEKSVWWYWLREYVVALFVPRLGSKQLGNAGFDPPPGETADIATAEVELGEAGTNAAMS